MLILKETDQLKVEVADDLSVTATVLQGLFVLRSSSEPYGGEGRGEYISLFVRSGRQEVKFFATRAKLLIEALQEVDKAIETAAKARAEAMKSFRL